MEPNPDLYDEVVSVYIHTIRQDSPEAAAAVQEIAAICGSRAALRATLVITLLKMEVQKSRSVEELSFQTELVKDFPEALPKLHTAIAWCLYAWGVTTAAPTPQANDL